MPKCSDMRIDLESKFLRLGLCDQPGTAIKTQGGGGWLLALPINTKHLGQL